MPTHRIRRGAALLPGEIGQADSSPIFIDSATGLVNIVPASTGSTKKVLVDSDSAQALSNKVVPVTVDAVDAAVPITGGIVVFTKGSASTHTLAAPATLGVELVLYAGSAQAHVITATGLIDDGITGGSKTTITLASFIGSSITLVSAQAGKWGVKAKNVVTSVA
jgi:hypothetical protein